MKPEKIILGQLDIQGIYKYIDSHTWKVSKDKSHSYSVCKTTDPDRIEFENFVSFIRANGFKQKFGKRTHTYLNIGGVLYWSMGWPVAQTILINRAIILNQE